MTNTKSMQASRLELYTRNDSDILKIIVNKDEEEIASKFLTNGVLEMSFLHELRHAFFENFNEKLNESLAIVTLPYLSSFFVDSNRYTITTIESNKHNFKVDEFGFHLEDYATIGDFLQECTGTFKVSTLNSDAIPKKYSDILEDSIQALILNMLSKTMNTLLENNNDNVELINFLKNNLNYPNNETFFASSLTQTICSKIKKLPIEKMFNLYQLKEEEEKLLQVKKDDELFKEQDEKINLFIDSFRTETKKEIIIFNSQYQRLNLSKDNTLEPQEKKSDWSYFFKLIQDACYDYKVPTVIVVKEETAIKNQSGETQYKVCGLIIHHTEFKVITKETLKEVMKRIAQENNATDSHNYRFSTWFYGYIPTF